MDSLVDDILGYDEFSIKIVARICLCLHDTLPFYLALFHIEPAGALVSRKTYQAMSCLPLNLLFVSYLLKLLYTRTLRSMRM